VILGGYSQCLGGVYYIHLTMQADFYCQYILAYYLLKVNGKQIKICYRSNVFLFLLKKRVVYGKIKTAELRSGIY